MKKARLQYIDALKVFAIFVVVWAHLIHHFGHSALNSTIHSLIYSFHMPLFAFVSGYFLSMKRGLWKGICNKCVRLGLPLVLWSSLWIVFNTFFIEKTAEFHVMALLKNMYCNFAIWDLWYLRALLLSFVVAYIAITICPKKYISLTVSYLILQTMFFVGIIPEDNPIVEFNGFIFLYPFVCLGSLFRDFESKIEKYDIYILAFTLIIYGVMLCFWDVNYTFYHTRLSLFNEGNNCIPDWNILYITLFRFVIGVSASLFFYLLFKRFRNIRLFNMPVITSLSSATLCIYIVHFIYVTHGLFPNFPEITGMTAFAVVLLTCVFVILVCYFVYVITSRSKLLRLILWGES